MVWLLRTGRLRRAERSLLARPRPAAHERRNRAATSRRRRRRCALAPTSSSSPARHDQADASSLALRWTARRSWPRLPEIEEIEGEDLALDRRQPALPGRHLALQAAPDVDVDRRSRRRHGSSTGRSGWAHRRSVLPLAVRAVAGGAVGREHRLAGLDRCRPARLRAAGSTGSAHRRRRSRSRRASSTPSRPKAGICATLRVWDAPN